MQRKNTFLSLFALTVSLYVYFAYFHVHDPKQILLDNEKLQHQKEFVTYNWRVTPTDNSSTGSKGNDFSSGKLKKEEGRHEKVWKSLVTFPQYENSSLTVIRSQQHVLWNTWLKKNNFISVGDYYNHCGEDNILIGKFVIIPSKNDYHGIRFKSFLNVTWAESIHSGLMLVEVSYAGIRLLRMRSDLCTSTKRTIKCPLKEGFHSFVVDFKLPYFTPKGHYQMTAYGITDDKQVLACMIAEAII